LDAIHTLLPIFIGFETIEYSFFDSLYSIIFVFTVQLGANKTLSPAENSEESIKV
jgi:hypothetical protein